MMDIFYRIEKVCLRKGLSHRTSDTYSVCVRNFLKWIKKDIRSIKKKDVVTYLDFLAEKGKSGSTLNVNFSAIKFVLETVLGKSYLWKTNYSKKPKTMPVFLTKEETSKLISSIKNKKHRTMVELLYGSGMRISELLNLRIKDIEIKNNYGWVRNGKGKKDRMFIIPLVLKPEIINLATGRDPNNFLFVGNYGQYSTKSMQVIVKKAAEKSGIKKNVHPHTLRHSFATHLIQNGYDVNSVQALLGHNSSQTTMVYVHMASPNLINVRSPLDNI